MLRERPNVFFVETLWGERTAIYGKKPAWIDEPLVQDTLSGAEIKQLADGFSTPGSTESAQRLLRNVAALNRAGVRLGLGTDTGGVTGGGYFGLASLVELELLVKAGLTAFASDRRRDAHLGGHPRTRRARHDRDRESRRPSSCSTRIRSTTSRTRGRSPPSTSMAPKSIAARCKRDGQRCARPARLDRDQHTSSQAANRIIAA